MLFCGVCAKIEKKVKVYTRHKKFITKGFNSVISFKTENIECPFCAQEAMRLCREGQNNVFKNVLFFKNGKSYEGGAVQLEYQSFGNNADIVSIVQKLESKKFGVKDIIGIWCGNIVQDKSGRIFFEFCSNINLPVQDLKEYSEALQRKFKFLRKKGVEKMVVLKGKLLLQKNGAVLFEPITS